MLCLVLLITTWHCVCWCRAAAAASIGLVGCGGARGRAAAWGTICRGLPWRDSWRGAQDLDPPVGTFVNVKGVDVKGVR